MSRFERWVNEVFQWPILTGSAIPAVIFLLITGKVVAAIINYVITVALWAVICGVIIYIIEKHRDR